MVDLKIEIIDLNTTKEIYAKNLAALLKSVGVKGVELAQALGVSQSSVSKWLSGEAFPDTVTIDKMRQRYGWTTDDLLGEKKPGKPDTMTALAVIAEALGFEVPRLRKRHSP